MRQAMIISLMSIASIATTFGLFSATRSFAETQWQVQIRPSLSVRYRGGVVAEHDTALKTLRITMPSSFPDFSPPADILFVYDDNTRWGSVTVGFEDGYATTFTQSDLTTIAPSLQPGTFVSVSKDMLRMEENHAAAIIFLRRVDI